MKTPGKIAFAFGSLAGLLLLGSAAHPLQPGQSAGPASAAAIQQAALPAPPPAPVLAPPPPPPAPPPTAEEALEDGVLIVVSIPSQMLYVLKDGKLWDSSQVSTGKEGNETPV